ncbi:DMT family transporter [Fundicoccus culcitae]|uniref:DMT family transporter n=1 Tax=Fundicoccus culcitae TaxID=2969821 RepID=A0ABY5P8J7_9LACT|nr:DMT family transporter [Fundicoccus culcitae]UUX35081.1 DMT family transporter [Fundicoccus culcitae]
MTSVKSTQNIKLGYFYILLTTIIFSMAEPIFKTVGGQFNAVQFVATRFFFGGLVLLPFAIKHLKKNDIGTKSTNKIQLTSRDIFDIVLCGILNVTISMTFYQMALALIPASVAAVLLCTNPVTTALFSRWLFKEPLTKNKLWMIVLSLIGVFIIVNPFGQPLNMTGLFYMLITVITFSLYSVIGKRTTQKLGGLAANSFTSIIGGLVTFVFIFATNIPAIGDFFAANGFPVLSYINLFGGYTLESMPWVIWIWVVQTGIGFLCYFKGMELTSATEASVCFLLKITLGPIISSIFIGETITLNLAIGMVITSIGSIVVLYPGLKQIFAERRANSDASLGN